VKEWSPHSFTFNYQSSLIITFSEAQVPKGNNMAAMPFSASFHGFLLQPKINSISSRLPSIAFSIPSIKTSFGSSKSAIFQHGFALQSSTLPGFLLKSRSFGVNARAATEKTIYDFTVKVSVFRNNRNSLFLCPLFLSL
jgi:hypothetical protein